jgi:hypothetical protein
MSGLRWSKKLLVFVSKVVTAATSSALNSKSNTLIFSSILSLRVVFERAIIPLCTSQRRITWAALFCVLRRFIAAIHFEKYYSFPLQMAPRLQPERGYLVKTFACQFAIGKGLPQSDLPQALFCYEPSSP